MWGLETIVAINREVASGKTLDQAYKACGIRMPFEKLVRPQPVICENDKKVDERILVVG